MVIRREATGSKAIGTALVPAPIRATRSRNERHGFGAPGDRAWLAAPPSPLTRLRRPGKPDATTGEEDDMPAVILILLIGLIGFGGAGGGAAQSAPAAKAQ